MTETDRLSGLHRRNSSNVLNTREIVVTNRCSAEDDIRLCRSFRCAASTLIKQSRTRTAAACTLRGPSALSFRSPSSVIAEDEETASGRS